MKYLILSFLFIATGITTFAQEQLKLPALSPTEKISQEFSTSSIDITYSRPSMRGRKIFGGLVPYGEVWRTGANAATKIKIGEDVTIGGQYVKAGEYALYTIPNKDEWDIILNKDVNNWGAFGYKADDDVVRFKIKPEMADKYYQTFTMDITNITLNSCKLELMWEKTKIIIPIEANQQKIDASIDKTLSTQPTLPYYQAANYYFESGQSLDKANSYIDKALAQNGSANTWYLKARIEEKLGHKEEAINAAHKSMDAAKGTPAESEFQQNNQELLDELNK